ncbi:MAG: hypothetical protein A2Z04_00480 [Chloroflexi bacterium RBG_16_57_9]|nr:MAG: hypothetical protein A2Z04_00480 [Chloroflexi bacterium RBG_16_57_9]
MKKNFVIGALLGATVGGAAAILYAPKSGEGLRREVRDRIASLSGLENPDARAQVAQWLDDGISLVEARRPEIEQVVAEVVSAVQSRDAQDSETRLSLVESRQRAIKWVDRGLAFLHSKSRELRETM